MIICEFGISAKKSLGGAGAVYLNIHEFRVVNISFSKWIQNIKQRSMNSQFQCMEFPKKKKKRKREIPDSKGLNIVVSATQAKNIIRGMESAVC